MSIDRAGRWWKGTTAEDLAEYLRELTADGYPADTIRASACASCGGTVFGLRGDRDEGSVMRLCRRCGTEAFIADSEDTWANARPRWCKCPCGSDDFAVAVGFSLREGGDVRWVTVGNRCAKCGILGSFADWRVNYGPSDHLIVMS
jgi:hypothetical protein